MIIQSSATGRPKKERSRVCVQSSGMGNVAALVIGAQNNIPAAQLRAQGMAGMDDIFDDIKSGLSAKSNELSEKLDNIQILLLAATVAAGAAATMSMLAYIARRK